MKKVILTILATVSMMSAQADDWVEPLVDLKRREVREFFHQDTQRFNRAFLIASECRRAMDSSYSTDRFNNAYEAKNHMDSLVNRMSYYGPADKNFAQLAKDFYTPGPGSVKLLEQHLAIASGNELVLDMSKDLIQDVMNHKISLGEAIRTYKSSFFVCGRDGDLDTVRMVELGQLVKYFKDNWTGPDQDVYDVMVDMSM